MLDVMTNVISLNAQSNLNKSQSMLATSIQRLSSGLRVNSAKDDAAGLSIATGMESQVRGIAVGIRNANDGISMAQVAEGALGSVTSALQRMRELAVQSANATNTSSDRSSLQQEFGQLQSEINRTLQGTTFNGRAILASSAGTQTFQVGADNNAYNRISITTSDMTKNTDVKAAINTLKVTSLSHAQSAMTGITSALDAVNSQRATMGAAQSRFDMAISSLQTTETNTQAAEGRIMDANFASETANMTRAQILQQAGVAMVSQANSVPQMALSLLR